MVYVTGDCHGDFRRFSTRNFPEQKNMTREDVVIILGDFGGIWDCDCSSKEEEYWLDWLNEKSFTILFIDGNHENFDRLKEFPVVDLYGGKAHKIRSNIYHLMRGYIFEIQGRKFFAFGGASSHDISDGILDANDYEHWDDFLRVYHSWVKKRKSFRVNHMSWWAEELPTEDEMRRAEQILKENGCKVDYILTHCCPQEVASLISQGAYKADRLTNWFNMIAHMVEFHGWYFGHYHGESDIYCKFHMRYEKIERII